MCLILFSYQTHPHFPLILAANRDEFYERPTERAHWWEDSPRLLAGKDLKAGGTWMGVHQSGKIAALTNIRDLSKPQKENAPSRGEIVTNFLLGVQSPEAFVQDLGRVGDAYNGFNLLAGYVDDLYWYSNESLAYKKVSPGIHGLSNHLLDTPWPKVEKGKAALTELVDREIDIEALFHMLYDQEIAPDAQLPATGVSLEWERVLSAMHIRSEGYGTRVSTVILVDKQGKVYFEERAFVPKGESLVFSLHFPTKQTK